MQKKCGFHEEYEIDTHTDHQSFKTRFFKNGQTYKMPKKSVGSTKNMKLTHIIGIHFLLFPNK